MKALMKFCLTTIFTVIIVIFLQRILEHQSVPEKLLDSTIIQQTVDKLTFLFKEDIEEKVNAQSDKYDKSDSTDVKIDIDEKESDKQVFEAENNDESLVILIENIGSLREAIKQKQVVLIAKEQNDTFILDSSEMVKALDNNTAKSLDISSYFVKSNLVEHYKDDFLAKGVRDMAYVRVYINTSLMNRIPKNTKELELPYYN
jgi:hypothetical protein